MEAEDLVASLETSLNRVNSAVWGEDGTSSTHLTSLATPRKNNESVDSSKSLVKSGKSKNKHTKPPYGRELHHWAAYGLPGPIGDRRTSLIKCFYFAIREFFVGSLRGGAIGFGLKGGVALVFGLLQRRKPSQILKNILNRDVLSFTKFLSLFLGIFRSVNAFLTHYRHKKSQSHAAIAATVASFASIVDDKRRRKDLALYLLFRGIDVLLKNLVRHKVVPRIPRFEQLMFGVSNMPIMYGFLYEPSILQPGYYKWILSMGNVTDSGLEITLRRRRDHLQSTGEVIPFRSCGPHYHEGPCGWTCFIDWFLGLVRAGKIYLPVHLVPLLLFRRRQLLKAPADTLLKTGRAFMLSCMFLTSYQATVKATCCYFRNTLQQDHDFAPLLGGFLTAFSCEFERRSRVSELMLYCAPKGAEAMWMLLRKRGRVRGVQYGEVGLLALGTGILMSVPVEDFKPTYFRALCFFVGS